MKKKYQKYLSATAATILVLTIIFTIIISSGNQAKAQISLPTLPTIPLPHFLSASLNADGTPQVTEKQLTDAGFTNVLKRTPQSPKFLPPVLYFTVGESASWLNGKNQTETSNIVAVTITPITDKTWLYNSGQPEFKDLAGMSQIRDSKAGYYFVITGPDKNKITSLMTAIKAAY